MFVILGRFFTKECRYALFFLLICFGCSPYKTINQEEGKGELAIQQSTQILYALHLEKIGQFNRSQQLWSQFLNQSQKAKEHYFKSSLVLYSPYESSEPSQPESETSKRLLSHFYSWQKQWEKALGVLPSTEAKSPDLSNKSSLALQRINILLALGRYEEALHSLQKITFKSFDLNFQQTLLWGKYYVLTNQPDKVMATLKVLEEEYLYLPVINLFPVDYLFNKQEYITYLEQSLLRFPGSIETVEALAIYYLDQKKWKELESLLMSRTYYNAKSRYWIFYGELYLARKQYKKLKGHLQVYKQRKGSSQPYLDLQARMLISTREWEKLKVLAINFIKLYPELIDGKLFLAEYYRLKGDTLAMEEVLELIN